MDSVISKLRESRLDDGRLLQTGQIVELPNGTAEIQLEIGAPDLPLASSLRLEFAHPKFSPVGVEISAEGVEILSGKLMDPVQRLIALGVKPREIQVFLDTGSIEVFLDGGRWAGKLYIFTR